VKKGARRRPRPATLPAAGARVVRVLTDVAGVDKEFDYALPDRLVPDVRPGSLVRVDLAGRPVGGWVVGVDVEARPGLALRPLGKVRGWGPEPAVLDLATWGAWRWATRRGFLLTTASPRGAVTHLPPAALRPPPAPPPSGLLEDLPAGAPVTVRLPPAADATPLVAELAQRGPLLVVVPSVSRAGVLTGRLRRAGGEVASLPEDWAQARAGAAVVVGTRAAAWAPCPGLAAVAVIDGHDEALGQEQAPTWHAVTVAAERARRASVPCVVISACPTLELAAAGPVRVVDRRRERQGWAAVEVLDRRDDDPRAGLYSQRLVAFVRTSPRVVCVLNRTGRARLLLCASCGEVARCERCGAALAADPAGATELVCPRCGHLRPPVCAACTSTRLRARRLGVSRAREDLEALAGRPVGEVTAASAAIPDADVLVGTEAVLRRLSPADRFGAVAFVDFDQELLAHRVWAGEEALGLLAHASRLVGGRRGRVLVQTRIPDHPALRAAVRADPGVLASEEWEVRRSLRLPPVTAVALVSGPGASAYVAGLRAAGVAALGPDGDRWLVKAEDAATLADRLAAVPRPSARLRVAVDPARL
jgi:primosomal protein N' (replication factor Y) (superfamily II helicase)